jgi:hypothetical protein
MIKTRLNAGTVRVTFQVPAAVSATAVHVCGDFNDWSPVANPLARSEDGHFSAVVDLAAGQRWHFRYLLDGQRWENDWAADDYATNIHGGEDSVVDLTDAAALPLASTAHDPDAAIGPAEPADDTASFAVTPSPRPARVAAASAEAKHATAPWSGGRAPRPAPRATDEPSPASSEATDASRSSGRGH